MNGLVVYYVCVYVVLSGVLIYYSFGMSLYAYNISVHICYSLRRCDNICIRNKRRGAELE